MQARPAEQTAREVIQELFLEVEDLCHPGNDGLLAAWQVAERKLLAAAHACHEVAKAIEQRPAPIFGEKAHRVSA